MLNLFFILFGMGSSLVISQKLSAIPAPFAKQLLIAEIVEAQHNKTSSKLAEILKANAPLPEGYESSDTSADMKKVKGQLAWIGTPTALEVPVCPEMVSIKCFILGELKKDLDQKTYDSVRKILHEIYQRDIETLKEPTIATIYAAILVKDKLYPRALSVIFPVISSVPELSTPYEWIQELYNEADRSDGKVAIKNL